VTVSVLGGNAYGTFETLHSASLYDLASLSTLNPKLKMGRRECVDSGRVGFVTLAIAASASAVNGLPSGARRLAHDGSGGVRTCGFFYLKQGVRKPGGCRVQALIGEFILIQFQNILRRLTFGGAGPVFDRDGGPCSRVGLPHGRGPFIVSRCIC